MTVSGAGTGVGVGAALGAACAPLGSSAAAHRIASVTGRGRRSKKREAVQPSTAHSHPARSALQGVSADGAATSGQNVSASPTQSVRRHGCAQPAAPSRNAAAPSVSQTQRQRAAARQSV